MGSFLWLDESPQIAQIQKHLKAPRALTIGNFDGVHLGHRELFAKLTGWAKAHHGHSVALTFHPHPIQVLYPEKRHVRLFDLSDQKEQMQKLGVDAVAVQPFSRDFSELSSRQFLEDFVMKTFAPEYLVVGHDFSFGARREGTLKVLSQFCDERKLELFIVPAVSRDGRAISTSWIRELLLAGDIQKANSFLGRAYYVRGIVEKGEARGRTLGFPTANIRPVIDFYPRIGVYACRAFGTFGERKAVMNVGRNKTFVEGDHHPIKLEVHLLDYAGDLYGQEIRVELYEYLRDEMKFSSIDQLKNQIQADIVQAQEILR